MKKEIVSSVFYLIWNILSSRQIVGENTNNGGIVRINGLLSFHIIFKCKRYKGSVTPSQIRDFRGAMQGRVDKGLFITTGTFTREVIKEATRDGAPPIDLIDGELCDKLKEFNLGLENKFIEVVEIRKDGLRIMQIFQIQIKIILKFFSWELKTEILFVHTKLSALIFFMCFIMLKI